MTTQSPPERKKLFKKLCAEYDITPSRAQALLYAAEHPRGHFKRLLGDNHDICDWLSRRGYLVHERDLSATEAEDVEARADAAITRAIAVITADWQAAHRHLDEAARLKGTVAHTAWRITRAGRDLAEVFTRNGFSGDEVRYRL